MKLLILRTGGDENIHGKEANCFYLMVPKLDDLKNKHGEKSEIIIHLAKKKNNYGRNKKRQLKLTNIEITQNNKSKIETATTSKNEETKKTKQNIIFKERN